MPLFDVVCFSSFTVQRKQYFTFRSSCSLTSIRIRPYLYSDDLPMGVWKQLAEYLYLRKPDPDRPKTNFVKYMHGINRLSLLLFIVALIILIIRLTVKK